MLKKIKPITIIYYTVIIYSVLSLSFIAYYRLKHKKLFQFHFKLGENLTYGSSTNEQRTDNKITKNEHPKKEKRKLKQKEKEKINSNPKPKTQPNNNNKNEQNHEIRIVEGLRPPYEKINVNLTFGQMPYPASNGISPNINDTIYITTKNNAKWKQIYVDLPAFHWETPKLLTNVSSQWFWMQEENYRHFEDTVNPIFGFVRVIDNGKYMGTFSRANNQTHYINIRGEPSYTETPEDEIAFFLVSHQVEYFQHFLDNGLPHISLMLLATGYKPQDVTIVMPKINTPTINDILKRWGFKDIKKSYSVSAKKLVLPEAVPVIHPKFYEVFKKAMNFDYSNADKIVFISRARLDTKKNERIILNQEDLVNALQEKYGDKFVLFKPGASFHNSFSLFEKAKIVIGSHGGAMYNSLFSSPNTKILEIIPVTSRGLYLGQASGKAIPRFAHLAMYTNAQLLGQPFYRYYQVQEGSTNMRIDVEDFLNFVEKVLNDDGEKET